MRARKLGPNQHKVMNVMVDVASIPQLAAMTGLDTKAVGSVIESLKGHELVLKMPGYPNGYALTHAGKRMVR